MLPVNKALKPSSKYLQSYLLCSDNATSWVSICSFDTHLMCVTSCCCATLLLFSESSMEILAVHTSFVPPKLCPNKPDSFLYVEGCWGC